MTEDNDQSASKRLDRILDAADAGRGDDIAGDTDHKEVAESLIEEYFRRSPRVRAAEDDGGGSLRLDELGAAFFDREICRERFSGGETAVSFDEFIECGNRSMHGASCSAGRAGVKRTMSRIGR